MADHAAHPVAGKRAILGVAVAEVLGRGGDGTDLVGRELPQCAGVVDVELPLAHRAVAAQADIGKRLAELRGITRVGPELLAGQPDLALDLGVDDGVAPRQSHRGPSPLAVRGDVPAVRPVFHAVPAGTNIDGPNGASSPEWQFMHWLEVTNSCAGRVG